MFFMKRQLAVRLQHFYHMPWHCRMIFQLLLTHDVMKSGVPKFCAVALALNDLGYKATGIVLDSGDLACLSTKARKFLCVVEEEFGAPGFGKMLITASNNLNEETIDALNKQGHEVDAFGIGAYLVTGYEHAGLGCVFELVELNYRPHVKFSEDITKAPIPYKKRCFRFYGEEGYPLVDLMIAMRQHPPWVGERVSCRDPFNESKSAFVRLRHREELLKCYWPGNSDKPREVLPSISEIRDFCMQQLDQMRPDHLRRINPKPYKVSVSDWLYDQFRYWWLDGASVGELR